MYNCATIKFQINFSLTVISIRGFVETDILKIKSTKFDLCYYINGINITLAVINCAIC